MSNQQVDKGISCTRWFFILVLLAVTLISALYKTELVMKLSPIVTVIALFTAVWLHGMARYGLKNMLVFFLITWLVSNFFEALSIQVGFPFGHYYYDKLLGPRLFEVPLIIMFAYFATGYSSWILSQVLLGQYAKPLSGKLLFLVPFIAAFLMVMWDLCIDPLCATVASLWVWRDGGPYFGVPIQNYFGWFFVVYISYQLFAFYIANSEATKPTAKEAFITKGFWLEIVTIYAIQGITQILQFFGATSHQDIYASMALVSVFTMLFVALLSFLKIKADSILI